MSFKEYNPPKAAKTDSEREAYVLPGYDYCGCWHLNYECTRKKNHSGRHIAGEFITQLKIPSIWAEWDNEDDKNDKGRYSSPSPSTSGEPIWKLAGFDSEEAYNKWKDSYEK